MAALLGAVGYILGTPMLLVAIGLGPLRMVKVAIELRDLLVVDDAILLLLVSGTWAVWVGSVYSVLAHLARLRRGEFDLRQPRVRILATFAVAIWALLASGRESAGSPVQLSSIVQVDRNETLGAVAVASLVTPALAIGTLREVKRRRERAMRTATRHERLASYSRASLALLDRLERLAIEADGEAEAVSAGKDGDAAWVSIGGRRLALDPADAASIEVLLAESERLEPARPAKRPETLDAAWLVMVRILGPVEAEDTSGTQIDFRKSRSLELLTWLVTHRERPTRSAARTALWDLDVQDATFHNVVSETRRALARVGLPDDSIGPPSSTRFDVHPSIVSDAEMLEHAYHEARSDAAATPRLREALDRVRDLPFAGAGYRWPDTEGLTSNLVLLIVDSAALVAERALAAGDTAGVFRATSRGLRVLAGHEELVSLRMRAHAAARDFAAVEDEWRRYERNARLDDGLMDVSKVWRLREDLLGRVT